MPTTKPKVYGSRVVKRMAALPRAKQKQNLGIYVSNLAEAKKRKPKSAAMTAVKRRSVSTLRRRIGQSLAALKKTPK